LNKKPGKDEQSRRWKGPEYKTGIKDPDLRRQLRLEIEMTSDGFDGKAFGLEFVKRAAGMSSGLWQTRIWTVWRGRSPPNRKNLLARRAGYVGTPADLGNFTSTSWQSEEKLWIMVIHLDLLAP
jgi:hypothetical protein